MLLGRIPFTCRVWISLASIVSPALLSYFKHRAVGIISRKGWLNCRPDTCQLWIIRVSVCHAFTEMNRDRDRLLNRKSGFTVDNLSWINATNNKTWRGGREGEHTVEEQGTFRTKWLLSFWAIKNCPFIKKCVIESKGRSTMIIIKMMTSESVRSTV